MNSFCPHISNLNQIYEYILFNCQFIMIVKGDVSSRLDRSFLLNHISSLINNMDSTESSNLKIIEIEVEADECVDKTAALLANRKLVYLPTLTF